MPASRTDNPDDILSHIQTKHSIFNAAGETLRSGTHRFDQVVALADQLLCVLPVCGVLRHDLQRRQDLGVQNPQTLRGRHRQAMWVGRLEETIGTKSPGVRGLWWACDNGCSVFCGLSYCTSEERRRPYLLHWGFWGQSSGRRPCGSLSEHILPHAPNWLFNRFLFVLYNMDKINILIIESIQYIFFHYLFFYFGKAFLTHYFTQY